MEALNNYVNIFDKNGYAYIPDFLSRESCDALTKEMFSLVQGGNSVRDAQCPLSETIKGAVCFDKLLEDLLPYFEVATGRKLLPTYSYARLYAVGDELKNHLDRPACEISATLTLGFSGKQWPIYMGNNRDKSAGVPILMNVGDAVLYKGTEKWHWREKYEGDKDTWLVQVFLHYVDANGPHKEWIYDKRKTLSHKLVEPQEQLFRIYDDILTSSACDSLIKTYDNPEIKKCDPVVGKGIVNTTIRNVERVLLPTHKDIGGRLAAVGLDVNKYVWNFNVTHANQSEFLKYPAGGRYQQHVDTFIFPNDNECRKITVLAFLNDDFKGGRFFIQNGHEKIYPPQKKGLVLAFPSFLVHGVEDVTEGTRYSVVTWMVGPWFK